MKKIFSPLLAAALVTGLSAGLVAFAEGEEAPAGGAPDAKEEPAKAPVKKHKAGKPHAPGKHHGAKKEKSCGADKKEKGCGGDGSGAPAGSDEKKE